MTTSLRSDVRAAVWQGGAFCTILLASSLARDAYGAGALFSRSPGSPRIQVEDGVVAYESASQSETLAVRFVLAQRASFTLLLPVPSEPKVSEAPETIVPEMDRRFPFAEDTDVGEALPRGWFVNEKPPKPVGSVGFDVAGAATRSAEHWLAMVGAQGEKDAETWIKYHADRGFYFVVVRYEMPAPPSSRPCVTPTVRVGFRTPMPFYPYFAEGGPPSLRVSSVWLISDVEWTPVANHRVADSSEWVRPWRTGRPYHSENSDSVLRALVDGSEDTSVHAGSQFSVMVFQDQKRARSGFGHVFFLAENAGSGAEVGASRMAFVRRMQLR